MKKIFGLLALVAILTSSSAADTDLAKAKIEEKLGRKVQSIRKIDNPTMWEIQVDNKFAYVDPSLSHAFLGSLLELDSKIDRTQQHSVELSRKKFGELPWEQAIVRKKGNGGAKLVLFEDPNCKFCKKLEAELANLQDTTIYVFPIGILSEDSLSLTRDVWCSTDRSEAWVKWMESGIRPVPASCLSPNEDLLKLAAKYNVTSTPTLLFADGTRLVGTQPLAAIQRRLTMSLSRN